MMMISEIIDIDVVSKMNAMGFWGFGEIGRAHV